MDSLTQALLGASVAEATIGARVGRRAALWGAVVGTLPDLDVFVSLGDPVSDFIAHRSVTHSLFTVTLAAPLLAWGVHRWSRAPPETYRRWVLTMWLVLITHIGLDCLTIYGTQVLWPFSDYPVGLGSVFIIDPIYTTTLALGLIALAFARPRPAAGHRLNNIALIVASLYLLAGIGIQANVREYAEQDLSPGSFHNWKHLAVLAAPFNILAWRIVVIHDDGYRVAWRSWIAPTPGLRFVHYPG